MSLLADAVAVLTAYTPTDAGQRRLGEQYLRHLAQHPDGIWRAGPPAHLTASCFVLDPSGSKVLLTLHRKGGFWVQLGGHLEADDRTLAGAARREASEESGLADLTLRPEPVGLHRHTLSAAFGRCREHLDVAYVATAPSDLPPVVSDESVDVAWWPVDQLPPTAVPDLRERLDHLVAALR